MVRRRLTLKRIDPWSVLKFGFVVNLAILGIVLLASAVVWFFIQRLGLIETICGAATDVGFTDCAVDGTSLFRAVLLLGLLGVVIQTGLFVFGSFLYNLIADLVGGVSFSYLDETPGSAARGEVPRAMTASGPGPGAPTDTDRGRAGPPAPIGATGRRPADVAVQRRNRAEPSGDETSALPLRDAAGTGVRDAFERTRADEPSGDEPMFPERTGGGHDKTSREG